MVIINHKIVTMDKNKYVDHQLEVLGGILKNKNKGIWDEVFESLFNETRRKTTSNLVDTETLESYTNVEEKEKIGREHKLDTEEERSEIIRMVKSKFKAFSDKHRN